tara:strand:- start:20619 stop:20912 length:294 start_codon:yes stop_codon:yes gene_type:complete
MEKKVVISCDYSELEAIIFKEYGHHYEIMPMEEIGSSQNAEKAEFNVCKGKLDEWQTPNITALSKGSPEKYCLSDILQDLCNKGKLEEGDYIVDVSW